MLTSPNLRIIIIPDLFKIVFGTCVGEGEKVGPCASVQTYPYNEANPTGPARTREETLKHAVVVVSVNTTVNSIIPGLPWAYVFIVTKWWVVVKNIRHLNFNRIPTFNGMVTIVI